MQQKVNKNANNFQTWANILPKNEGQPKEDSVLIQQTGKNSKLIFEISVSKIGKFTPCNFGRLPMNWTHELRDDWTQISPSIHGKFMNVCCEVCQIQLLVEIIILQCTWMSQVKSYPFVRTRIHQMQTRMWLLGNTCHDLGTVASRCQKVVSYYSLPFVISPSIKPFQIQ